MPCPINAPVGGSAEISCAEARGVQSRDGLVLAVDDLVVSIYGNATTGGSNANPAMTAPERRGIDGFK